MKMVDQSLFKETELESVSLSFINSPNWVGNHHTTGEELPILNWENDDYFITTSTTNPQLDWIDNEFLKYSIASEIQLEFHGFPTNVSNARGGSSTEKFHSVNAVRVYGWQVFFYAGSDQ